MIDLDPYHPVIDECGEHKIRLTVYTRFKPMRWPPVQDDRMSVTVAGRTWSGKMTTISRFKPRWFFKPWRERIEATR
jgi:hypothetical protein